MKNIIFIIILTACMYILYNTNQPLSQTIETTGEINEQIN